MWRWDRDYFIRQKRKGVLPFRFYVFLSILSRWAFLYLLSRVYRCRNLLAVQAAEIVPVEGVQPRYGGAADALTLLAAAQLGAGRKEDHIPVGHIEIAQFPA